MQVNGDLSNATQFTHIMMNLDKSFNTNKHLSRAAEGAFSILQDAFGVETDVHAEANEETFHHVYEWEHIGRPYGRLFDVWLDGNGGSRTVTWDWLPSKTHVPIVPEDYPEDFDTSRLNDTHIFYNKAMVLEYGTTVKVKRKSSPVLVIPYPETYSGLGQGKYVGEDGDKQVLITRKPYSFSPGERAGTVGNFTAWFIFWWGNRANDVLDQTFNPTRDNAFKRAFESKMDGLKTYQQKSKTLRWSVDTRAAAEGAKDAMEIADDVEKMYLRMVRAKMGRV